MSATIRNDASFVFKPDWWPKQGPTEFIRDDSHDGEALVRALDAAMEALHWALHQDKPAAEAGLGDLSRDARDAMSRAFHMPAADPAEDR